MDSSDQEQHHTQQNNLQDLQPKFTQQSSQPQLAQTCQQHTTQQNNKHSQHKQHKSNNKHSQHDQHSQNNNHSQHNKDSQHNQLQQGFQQDDKQLQEEQKGTSQEQRIQQTEQIQRTAQIFKSMSVYSDNGGETEQPESIKVQVMQGILKQSTFSKQQFYIVDGHDNHGKFLIQRSYDEFLALRSIMVRRWPGCFIPSLTNNSKIKNKPYHTKHILVSLAYFLRGLAATKQIYYKEEVQIFLRSSNLSMIEMNQQMPKLAFTDVISRFNSSFGQIPERDPKAQNAALISMYPTTLRKIMNNLLIQCEHCLNIAQSYEKFTTKLDKFSSQIKSYEELNLNQYTNKNLQGSIIREQSEHIIDNLMDLYAPNPFYQIYISMEQQFRDAKSFLQVIQAKQCLIQCRDKLQQQINSYKMQIQNASLGRKSIYTMTSLMTPSEFQVDLQNKLLKSQTQKQSVIELNNVVENILAIVSISTYRKYVIMNHRQTILNWGKLVKNQNPLIITIWKQVREEAEKLHKKYQQ